MSDEATRFLLGVRQVLHIVSHLHGDAELNMLGRLIPYGGGGPVPMERLSELAARMTHEQFSDLMQLQSRPESEDEAAARQRRHVSELLCGELQCSGKELAAFGPILQLRELVELLVQVDVAQLMALFEALPTSQHAEHLRHLVVQLQDLFQQMDDETFRHVHSELQHCAAGALPARLRQVLVLADPFVFLYQPLQELVRLALSDALCLVKLLRSLKPVQVLQLAALRQMEQLDVMRLYNAMADACRTGNAVPMPFPLPTGLPQAPPRMKPEAARAARAPAATAAPAPPATAAAAAASTAAVAAATAAAAAAAAASPAAPMASAFNEAGTHGMAFVDEPDEAVVYRRNVKAHPTLQVTVPAAARADYVVTVVLVRCDINSELADKIESGGEELSVKGGSVSFKKIKIAITSHQTSETMFALRFKLVHRTTRAVEAMIQSRPFIVVSHTSQVSGVKRSNAEIVDIAVPAVQECIPPSGPASGGTRIALLGGDFVESPSLVVRFGNTIVPASMRSAGTLLLRAPPHEQGAVEVRVSNDNSSWSATAATFVFEDVAAPAGTEPALGRFEAGATSFADEQADLFASLPINLVRAMDDIEFDRLFESSAGLAAVPDEE